MKRARYTSEFKSEAVRLVKNGQNMTAVSSTLNISNQTLCNWVKADQEGNLLSVCSKPVTQEQMELARLRAEVARLKMKRDISKIGHSALCKGIGVKYTFVHSNPQWSISLK